MCRLYTIHVLCVLDVEPQEIAQLSGRINLRLPRIFTLAHHGRSHDLVSVFCRYQICCFQEHSSTLCEWQCFPCWLGCKSSIYRLLHIGLASIGISGHNIGVGRGVVLREDCLIVDLPESARPLSFSELGYITHVLHRLPAVPGLGPASSILLLRLAAFVSPPSPLRNGAMAQVSPRFSLTNKHVLYLRLAHCQFLGP